MTAPIGVLAMAYGTAAGPEDIERYYTDIRGGRAPSPELLADLKGRYAAIGNRFPLLVITGQQAAALEAELNAGAAGGFRVYLGMKHSAPFIAEGVARMRADGISRAVGLVLAPHYSRLSVGGYIERVQAAVGSEGPSFTFVTNWHDHPMFVEVLASRVRDALETLTAAERERAVVVFSAHSLPARIRDEGDPYPAQLQETADLVAARLALADCRTAWQSAGRTPEPWLGPDLSDVISEVSGEGATAVVSCACGFVADHLEILYDLDIEAAGVAREAGIRFVRTRSMNADPAFVRALATVVRDHLSAEARTA
jgi:protoporphyrin/coproporphyrin ferrochelatase